MYEPMYDERGFELTQEERLSTPTAQAAYDRFMGNAPTTNPLENLTADQLRASWDQLLKTESERELESQQTAVAEAFLAAHPEYVPSEENGGIMEMALAYTGKAAGTVEDFEDVYTDLRNRGLLKLDTERTAAQEREARIESAPRRMHSGISARRSASAPIQEEPDPDRMSTDELRDRALRQILGGW